MNKSKVILLVVVAVIIGVFFHYDLSRFLTLEYLQSQRENFLAYYEQNTLLTLGLYFFIYVTATSLSLPGAAIITLAGGALFGLVTGTIIVSFASSVGATLAFLVARFILKDSIQSKYADKLKSDQ